MAAHRYWRLNLPPELIGNGTLLSTVALRAVPGGSDVSGLATLTSSHALGRIAAYFDGNAGTDFYATSASTVNLMLWIAFDFGGSPQDIQEVMYRTSSNAALAPANVSLWYKDFESEVWKATSLYARAFDGATTNTNYTFNGFTEFSSIGVVAGPEVRRAIGTALPESSATVLRKFATVDLEDGGVGRIVGTVKEKGTPSNLPLARKVRLINEFSGRLIRETWSNAAGDYVFNNVAIGPRYTVVTYDYTNTYRAVIADNLQAEPMP